MRQPFTVSFRQEGEWFIAQCIEVDVASRGKTSGEALENLRDTLKQHFTLPGEPLAPLVLTLAAEASTLPHGKPHDKQAQGSNVTKKRENKTLRYTIEFSIDVEQEKSPDGQEQSVSYRRSIRCDDREVWKDEETHHNPDKLDFFLSKERNRYLMKCLETDLINAARRTGRLAEFFAIQQAVKYKFPDLEGKKQFLSQADGAIDSLLEEERVILRRRLNVERRGKQPKYDVPAYKLAATYKAYHHFFSTAREGGPERVKELFAFNELDDDLLKRLFNASDSPSEMSVDEYDQSLSQGTYQDTPETLALIKTARVHHIALKPEERNGITLRQLRRMIEQADKDPLGDIKN